MPYAVEENTSDPKVLPFKEMVNDAAGTSNSKIPFSVPAAVDKQLRSEVCARFVRCIYRPPLFILKKLVPFIVMGVPVVQAFMNIAPLFKTTASPLPVAVKAAKDVFVFGRISVIV